MKQAEAKVRILSKALILAAIVAVLGTCQGGFTPESDDAPTIGRQEGDMVRVRVNTGTALSRSVADGDVEFYANIYEVVFFNGTDKYYQGTGTAEQGYVTLSVPVSNSPYAVLLLVGYNQTLLGAGYRPIDSNPATDVYIKANQANTVSVTLKRIQPQWDSKVTDFALGDTNDFQFSSAPDATIVGVSATDRYISLAEDPDFDDAVTGITPGTTTFTVKFDIGKLADLLDADTNTSGTPKVLTIADYNVRLWARYRGNPKNAFTTVTFTGDDSSSDGVTATDVVKNGSDGYKIMVYNDGSNDSPVSFTNVIANNHNLPAKDVDGLLEFELKYYAFGTPDSKGRLWIIRNGLTRTTDGTFNVNGTTEIGTGTGSFLVVKIGAGSEEQGEEVLVPVGFPK
jgi:hypothetical protein